MADWQQITGNDNVTAGRDVHYHYPRQSAHEQALERLTVERQQKYALWKSYSEQLQQIDNGALTLRTMALIYLPLALIDYLLFFSGMVNGLSAPAGSWVSVEQYVSFTISPLLLGPIALAVLAAHFAPIWYENKRKEQREQQRHHLQEKLNPLAVHINELDIQIMELKR